MVQGAAQQQQQQQLYATGAGGAGGYGMDAAAGFGALAGGGGAGTYQPHPLNTAAGGYGAAFGAPHKRRRPDDSQPQVSSTAGNFVAALVSPSAVICLLAAVQVRQLCLHLHPPRAPAPPTVLPPILLL